MSDYWDACAHLENARERELAAADSRRAARRYVRPSSRPPKCRRGACGASQYRPAACRDVGDAERRQPSPGVLPSRAAEGLPSDHRASLARTSRSGRPRVRTSTRLGTDLRQDQPPGGRELSASKMSELPDLHRPLSPVQVALYSRPKPPGGRARRAGRRSGVCTTNPRNVTTAVALLKLDNQHRYASPVALVCTNASVRQFLRPQRHCPVASGASQWVKSPTWTVTDASNIDCWPENMPFGDVNDSGRAVQGAIARWFKDWNGSIVASGSSNAFTITSNRTIASYANNDIMWWRANHTNTGAATLNLNGIGIKDIISATGSALTAGDITSGQIVGTYYNSSLDDWVLITPAVQGSASDAATGLIELAIQSEMEGGCGCCACGYAGTAAFPSRAPKGRRQLQWRRNASIRCRRLRHGRHHGQRHWRLYAGARYSLREHELLDERMGRFETNLASCGLLSADSDDAKTASSLQVQDHERR